MASYAEPADLIKRHDARTVGDLCSDNGVKVSPSGLLTDANLLAALADASGEIDAALLQGKRYTTADLTALTGNSLAYLKRITCQIAMAHLWGRRPYLDDDSKEVSLTSARSMLDKLRRGENIFDVELVKEAGVADSVTPTASSIERQNLTVDAARGRNGYYPPRRLPT